VKVHFIAVSQNAKTGPIPVSIIERASCWPGCALYENGCYAETGALVMHWDRVSHGLTGGSWSAFCAKIAALRPGRLWRYAQAGDLPGYGPAIDGAFLQELVAANAGKKAIAFTHKPVLGDDPVAAENRRLITASAEAGFTVNLSANNPAQADRLAELGIAPVVTVLVRDYARRAIRHRFKRRRDEWAETIGEWRDRTASLPLYTPAGRRIAICPGDLYRRHLQKLWRLLPAARCCDRLSGPWRLAAGRSRHRGPRRARRRQLGLPRPPHDGRGHRPRGSSSLTPSPSGSAGLERRGVRNNSAPKRFSR
jgi:hypothetical protein